MDRLMRDASAAASDDPDFGPGARRPRSCRRASQRAERTRRRSRPGPLPRRRDRQPGVRAAVPRLAGREGHRRSTTSPPTSTRPALFRNQWQFRPEAGGRDRRPTTSSRTASARCCASSWPRPRPSGVLVPAGRLRLLPGQQRRRRPRRCGRTTTRTDGAGCASRSPASARSRSCASPTSSGRSSRGEADYAAFHIVTMGDAVSERPPSCSPTTSTRTTCCCHGLGVEMAEALAEYWHRRIREEWGFADEDGPTLGGLFRQQYRGGRYSWGYPACPDLEDNAQGGRAARAPTASASRSARRPASSTSPSRRPPPSSATTPRPSTSSSVSRTRPSGRSRCAPRC